MSRLCLTQGKLILTAKNLPPQNRVNESVGETASSNLTLNIVPANLLGKGLVAGTFTGQDSPAIGNGARHCSSDRYGRSNRLNAASPISFTKPFNGANPATQIVNIANETALADCVLAATSTGGAWLTINRGAGCCYSKPDAVTLTAISAANLLAGAYTEEIIATTQSGSEAVVIRYPSP